ncbi:RloB family protein [Photobacterium damselae]|uniref:RloB family protein n=1 Tax=Photobacterium damselae TaxID=38293 RepID=UPI001EFD085A|nr:RloB family protein [Photobacterium damselae]MCG9703678.1 RloB family protein [Photobacterium damselae]
MFQRSSSRGSKYKKKIEPIYVHIAYEGKEDEKVYFEALEEKIGKRFAHLVTLIPVPKSSTQSSPEKVTNDLVAHLAKNKINLNKVSNHYGFIVIDKDHFFNDTHSKKTWDAIVLCKQKGIEIICSNPCFEVWLLCHYIDVSSESEEFRARALENGKVSANKTFLKKEFSNARGTDIIDVTLEHTANAYNNEEKLKRLSSDAEALPPISLHSNVGKIIKLLDDNGIPLLS